MKADKDWKENSRSFLFSEVKSSVVENEEISLLKRILFSPTTVFSAAVQQAWAVAIIAVIIIGGVFSTQAASQNARPGDSLYLARVLSEKAKVAVTFNKEERVKLDTKLASNRAKDITEVLAEIDSGDDSNEESKKKAEKLSESFKEEIETVKKNMEEMENMKTESEENKQEEDQIAMINGQEPGEEEAIFGIGSVSSAPEVKVTDAGKEDKGVEVYNSSQEEDAIEEEQQSDPDNEDVLATTSPQEEQLKELLATSTLDIEEDDVEEMFSNAQQSLDAKDFDSAKEMLEAIDNIINEEETVEETGDIEQIDDSGEVKGVTTGSTTEESTEDQEDQGEGTATSSNL